MSLPIPTGDPQTISEAALAWAESICTKTEHQLTPYSDEQLERIALRPRLKRSIDFAMGRRCARAALARLGMQQAVGVMGNRAPKWPRGFVGSISHSEQFAWAAARPKQGCQAIGVDTESRVDDLTFRQLFSEILSDDEWDVLQALKYDDATRFTLAFSAKESFYKAWSHRTGQFFDFHQATIVHAASRGIQIELTEKNPNFGMHPQCMRVHFLVEQDEIFTATWMA